MSDQANFPTGNWTGFYKWSRSNFEYTMELILEFESENIDGVGRDPVGQFVVDGFYDPDNGEATWVKRYTGSHDVYYEGYRKHDGIWGTWELSHGAKGGFFIWPEGNDENVRENDRSESEILDKDVQLILTPSKGDSTRI